MLQKTLISFTKPFSTTSQSWRIQLQQRQLVSQISSILLQRHNWASILPSLNLSHNLTPPLFLQILNKIQSSPQISLNFFNWARSKLGFQPDLKTNLRIIWILAGSGETRPVKPILESVIGVDPPTRIVDSVVETCKGTNLHPVVFGMFIECYAKKGLHFECLEVYKEIISFVYLPKIGSLNVVLDALHHAGEFRLGWCLCGSMIRNGVLPNLNTWTIMARILCKLGKFDRVVRLIDLGICNYVIFGLIIDGYSKVGNFGAALDQVSEMCKRKFEPGFGIYSSILDKACEFGDMNVVETVMQTMIEKNLIPELTLSVYDDVIRKFCDSGKTYVTEMLLGRARDEGFGLKDATFGCILGAFSRGGRVKEAIKMYQMSLEMNIKLSKSSCLALADIICKGNPSEEVNKLLNDLIRKGLGPSASDLSKFMISLCRSERWKEAESRLEVILEEGLLVDSECSRALVKHYCSCGRVDAAITLHDKLGNVDNNWDVTTYNTLLRGLFVEKRVNEAIEIFDCMRRKNVVNKASFLVMICGLSQEKEMRKAMWVHDEMLKLGLKPSLKTYKSLISVFA